MRHVVADGSSAREVHSEPLTDGSIARVRFTPDAPGEYQLSLADTRRAGRLITDAPLRLFVPPPAHMSPRMQ